MIDDAEERALLDHLLEESRLYKKSSDFLDLLEFIGRLPNFAPFNALLLHIQKPGIRYAASRHDWETKFRARVREHARPLLIMWPFGPVALVYDVADVDGENIPIDAHAFVAKGPITQADVKLFIDRLTHKEISVQGIDVGDASAGSIRMSIPPKDKDTAGAYLMKLNINHPPPVAFVTIAHELAHLYLGHLGEDLKRRIKGRQHILHARRELEAEAVAYMVARRQGIESRSQAYLANYVGKNETVDDLDLYLLTKAAGQIESLLAIATTTRFKPVD